MTMRFRNKSIADSVTERISAIAESVKNDKPMPAPRGSATVALQRQPDGGLQVTKTFENGETELLTISTQSSVPEGFTDVTQGASDQVAPVEDQLSAGIDAGGVVEAAALGGDSLDALLRA